MAVSPLRQQVAVRILGIDPGSVRTGYAVIEHQASRSRHIASGHLALGRADMAQRLGQLMLRLQALIEQHQPDECAVESVFLQKNVSSAIKLGQARGVAIASVAARDIPVAEYPPATIKQMVCGGGRADKQQIQFMVQRLLNHRHPMQEDEADALAVALCHAHARQLPQSRAAR